MQWLQVSDSGESLDAGERHADAQSPVPQGEPDPRFRLDPAQLPKRLDLAVDEGLLSHLEAMAARSGRCLNEIVVELLDRHSSRT